jgi:hypothetical protein
MNKVSAIEDSISQEERFARVNLTQALYKTGYCICIPDHKTIILNSRQVDSDWLRQLLLTKNQEGNSILARLLNLALRNHSLTEEQFSHLFDLINCLVKQLNSKQIGCIFRERRRGQLPVMYNFLYQLSMTRHLNWAEYQRYQLWRRNLHCISSLHYFLSRVDVASFDQFVSDSPYSSFLLLKQLLRQISNPSTPKQSLTLFILTIEKIIDHFPQPDFDKKVREKSEQGVSFLCEQLFKGLCLLIKNFVVVEKEVPIFISIMTRILEKTQQETRQSLPFEAQGAGCLFLLGCLILGESLFGIDRLPRSEYTVLDVWLNLIIATLNRSQIKQILHQGQQMIEEQKSITSTQKKRFSTQWHNRLINYLDLVNKENSNHPEQVGCHRIKKMKDKKMIFFSQRLIESFHMTSAQDPIYSVDEQRPLLSQSNFF